MRVEGAFFAEKIESRPDGRLNVEGFGPFTVGVSKFPVILPDYHVPVLLYFAPEDAGKPLTLTFTIVGPHNEEMMKHDLPIDPPFPPQMRKIVTMTLTNLELAQPATYRIHFEVDGVGYEGPSFDVTQMRQEVFRQHPN